MSMHFFDLYIPFSLENFDANVSPFTLNFFNYFSHGVATIFGFADYSSCELATFKSNVVERAE
jgi:hypothetical protein